MNNEAVLEIENLFFSRNDFSLSVSSLNIQKGEFVFVLGLNGSGKTTFLNLISNIVSAKKGSIKLLGKELSLMSNLEIAQCIALVEQETDYVFPYTVVETVLMGRFARNKGRFFERDKDLKVVEDIMRDMHIYKLAKRSVSSLSGGEKRRVEIARALAQETPMMLFDEPLAFLDVKQQEFFFELILELHKKNKKTIICVTHRIDIVKKYGDRFIVFDKGQIVADLEVNNSFDKTKFLSILDGS